MKKSAVIGLLIMTLLFLISCQRVPGGEDPQSSAAALNQVKVGTQGIDISIVPNYPPSTIYDLNELIVLAEVKNKGNYNLAPQDCFIQVTGFDPNILRGSLDVPRTCAENLDQLDGKTVFNLDGGFNQIEFRSSNIALPNGIFDYEPRLNLLACYNYKTTASPQVCVDPLLFQVNAQQKACDYRRGISVSGGQGGPVGVSNVNVDQVGNRAIFDITISNLGSGQVLSPFANIQGCGNAVIERQDFDKVSYAVRLANTIGTCNPRDGIVRLSNGRGKILCSFDIPGTSAYETPLLIDLDYSYMQSISKQVKIIKTPQ
jgi:hypothetical protein